MSLNRRRVLAAMGGLGLAGSAVPQVNPLRVRPASAGDGDFVEGEPGCGRVAIIFNIGAGHEPALSILDTLKAYQAPTTMFLMGWWLDYLPETARYLASFGHPLGSHGNLPPELTTRSDADVKADIWATEEAFLRVLGYKPEPYITAFAGASDARVNAIAALLGYTMIGWQVETADWNPEVTASMIFDSVANNVYDGGIIEMHLDSRTSTQSTAVALPWVLDMLIERGYRLVTIPELMQPCS
jgi:peptidoglycan/xylan/chitin deacetylase (PgdA/CDA1 family)